MVDAATCGRALDAMLHGEEETDMSKRGGDQVHCRWTTQQSARQLNSRRFRAPATKF
jgi:hypothetical protein